MNQKSNLKSVTLKDLWDILVRRLLIIILAACVFGGGFFAVNRMRFVPQYQSTATLYLLRQSDSSNATDISSDLSLSLKLVNDCTYFLKSHTVLDSVIDELSLDMGYGSLYSRISTSNPEDTRILEVTVTAGSPELAKSIVDKICTTGAEKIDEAMGFQQVNVYELGTINESPCNETSMLTFIFVGILAAAVTYIVFLFIFLLDDRIKSDEDVERYLGLSILGTIPTADSKRPGKNGYYRTYPSDKKKSAKNDAED